jgi:Zn-dependent peptidase ImmA (M78 family)
VRPAAELARLLLDEFRITGKPDLDALCNRLGLRVRQKEFDGFDGILLRSKTAQKGIIGVNAGIREPSRKRFTVAHEIGHFVIPHHREIPSACAGGSIESFSRRLAVPELEANEFAAELLLPSRAVASRFDLDNPSLSRISLVANDFETSLSATTWRFLDLTGQPCAMVWSHAGRAVWYRTNDALPFLMPMKSLPSPVSIAGRIFAGESFPDGAGMQDVDADAWFYPSQAQRIGALWEDSIYLQNYTAVFTLLWAVNLQEDKGESMQDELLEELDPEEFTLGRKRWPQ